MIDIMKLLDKLVKVALISILIVAIILVVYLIVIHNPGEDYTEFYLIDQDNNTTNYPINITRDSVRKINVGIINKEHDTTNYTVIAYKDDETIAKFNKTLKNNEEYEFEYYIDSTHAVGENQSIDFKLYKGNVSAPYRTLYLKYNVV